MTVLRDGIALDLKGARAIRVDTVLVSVYGVKPHLRLVLAWGVMAVYVANYHLYAWFEIGDESILPVRRWFGDVF